MSVPDNDKYCLLLKSGEEDGAGKTHVLVQSERIVIIILNVNQTQNCQVSESEKALCDNVDEGDIERSIVEGPPAAGCREDSEREYFFV